MLRRPHFNTNFETGACDYPYHGYEIIRSLKTELESSEGSHRSYAALAEIIGTSKASAHNWCHGHELAAVRALFLMLERLPTTQRMKVLDRYCRVCPRLEHPWLAHDLAVTAHLGDLARQVTGLTLIEGDSPHDRTFVITAIGRAFVERDTKHRPVSGFDIHRPNWFVPLEGVSYSKNLSRPADIQARFNKLLGEILSTSAPVLLFNLLHLHERGELVQRLEMHCRSRHVIIANPEPIRTELQEDYPVHRLRVSRVTGFPQWIRVGILRL
jgi:hypothetical protein